MNIDWISQITHSGVNDFGDPAGEVKAATTATIASPLADLGLIRVAGEDAAVFLHNLMTNDIKEIPLDGVQRAGFCTPKGRLLADFLIWREPDAYLLQMSADILPGILKKLSMYVLRSKVKLSDVSAERALIGLAGNEATAILNGMSASVPETMHTTAFTAGTVIALTSSRFQLVISAAEASAVWQQLSASAHPVGISAWRWLDIAAGIPRITTATQELFVPQMVNFELIGGIGFKKGCYPGQEIVARTQYLGKIKKRMWRARLAEGEATAGSALYAPSTGTQVCGNAVTVAPSPAGGTELLVVIPSDVAELGEVHVGAPDGQRLTLLDLPYQID